MDRDNTFFGLISDVTAKEMEMVGVTAPQDSVVRAQYISSVQRVQEWTFEHLASMSDDPHTKKMFEALAQGVRNVPDMDLIMGESGASGS